MKSTRKFEAEMAEKEKNAQSKRRRGSHLPDLDTFEQSTLGPNEMNKERTYRPNEARSVRHEIDVRGNVVEFEHRRSTASTKASPARNL